MEQVNHSRRWIVLAAQVLAAIGRTGTRSSVRFFAPFGLGIELLGASIRGLVQGKLRRREILDQCFHVGVESVPVIVFSLCFLSFILITELSFHMRLVLRQDSLVPGFASLLLVREMGPVVTALLLCSRVGAGIAAEIGLMKHTEQLDALDLIGLEPRTFLGVPRLFACVFGTLALSILALGVGIGGGAWITSVKMGNPWEAFFQSLFLFARPRDFVCCCVKSSVFGGLFALISMTHGFRAEPGSTGIGEAATRSVVESSLWIIAADFALTYAFYAV